jgi:hypothetical protein
MAEEKHSNAEKGQQPAQPEEATPPPEPPREIGLAKEAENVIPLDVKPGEEPGVGGVPPADAAPESASPEGSADDQDAPREPPSE